jgi:endonuclease/exonuclease/phosphatase family metal-dependent hydrolase
MRRFFISLLLLLAASLPAQPTNEFIVAAYNVENWNSIERRGQPNQPKPKAERDAVLAVVATVRPDVLAVEEMGKTNDFAEFVAGLREKGLDYRHHEWIQAVDADRHVCVLSRFPIVERHSVTNAIHLLDGKPMAVQRGILDVLIKVNDHYSFRALVVHLKSKRTVDYGDQAAIRLGEARLLREHIGKILKKSPTQNLVAMGDFNDTPDSEPVRAILGEPPFQLFALHPLDSEGKDGTHLWRARNQYSRIDYLVLSPGMSNEFIAGSARIADVPAWKTASDHRMIYGRFYDRDLGGGSLGQPTRQ